MALTWDPTLTGPALAKGAADGRGVRDGDDRRSAALSGQESHFGPPGFGAPPYVHFLRISDGAVAHRIAVPEETRAVEVHDSAVYTTSYDYAANVRSMTRGTTDALDATWRRSYPVGEGSQSCPGSGDATDDGVDHDVVYSGNDGGMVVADAADGRRLLPGEVTALKVFPGQGFAARRCPGGDPDTIDRVIVDTQGKRLARGDRIGGQPVADQALAHTCAATFPGTTMR